jgi:hypothetical protein
MCEQDRRSHTIPDINLSASKSVVVNTLYRLQRKAFRQHVNVKEELLEEALQGLPSTSTRPKERQIQLQSLFFHFRRKSGLLINSIPSLFYQK